MTASVIEAPPVAAEDLEADWAVVLRLLWHRELTAQPSAADLHLATWLLLDLGREMPDICRQLGMTLLQVKRVKHLRQMAATPPRRQARMCRPLLDYRQFAPSAFERRMLSVDGITRPE